MSERVGDSSVGERFEAAEPVVVAAKPPEKMAANKVLCEACPVLCQISEGRLGACDRWGNVGGKLTRMDPVVLMKRPGVEVIASGHAQWNGQWLNDAPVFVSGVGSGTTYPDYKPAPFIVASRHRGVDMVTVVTEGIFSYCSFKVKIDTDRYLGAEQSTVRYEGEAVGHVTTIEYGSQFLSLGGVHHLTGGSKREGRVT
ncbi:MAG TPA: 6-hydroxynicotinate reductase, partial [Burkholderiaceae bacterium]|nr:6-hydroxynicotinate reductase [Burkholderiaceae bacterium]